MNTRYDVIVVGGGIVGLAHAWMAAEHRQRVLLLERDEIAQGASVRNFGMVWPIGQTPGEMFEVALRSRKRWLALDAAGVVNAEPCGSIHVAHSADEHAVLEEFCDSQQHAAHMMTAEEVVEKAPIVNRDGLKAGMFSSTELRINPRLAAAQIAHWLQASHGVSCCFGKSVVSVDEGTVTTSDGQSWSAERVIICSGSDLKTLYPNTLLNSGIRLCKLQMLKVRVPQFARPMPHIASGLTLRHYASFGSCPSLAPIKARIAKESPELDRFGIHVMASAFANGDILLGDSHEYDCEITPFDKQEIEDLILRELRKILRLHNWTIQERWHGVYAKHPTLPIVDSELAKGINAFVAIGGTGMTMAFGLAERAWDRWLGKGEHE
jgi:FAD dependent oxidoreductase TIGR03364